jgi:hypothetical protein
MARSSGCSRSTRGSRGDVVTLMAEHNCAANASAIESDDQATPAPEEEPGIDDGPDDEEPAGE